MLCCLVVREKNVSKKVPNSNHKWSQNVTCQDMEKCDQNKASGYGRVEMGGIHPPLRGVHLLRVGNNPGR